MSIAIQPVQGINQLDKLGLLAGREALLECPTDNALESFDLRFLGNIIARLDDAPVRVLIFVQDVRIRESLRRLE